MVLVTGAGGQVGTALVHHLRSAGHDVVASDAEAISIANTVQCDLRSDDEVSRLFRHCRYSVVVHLAGILPTAFCSDPLTGGDVNLAATLRLLRACVNSGTRRFVFGSSTSVYGSSWRAACGETAHPMPDEPYGAAKLAIERILEVVPSAYSIQAVSLRIARVLGPGARKSASAWRSRILERPNRTSNRITIPFAPDAKLSIVHVDDLARMLQILVEVRELPAQTYNTPVELLRVMEIKQLAEEVCGWQVSLGKSRGGPEIDGTRFSRDFGFVTRSLREHMQSPLS